MGCGSRCTSNRSTASPGEIIMTKPCTQARLQSAKDYALVTLVALVALAAAPFALAQQAATPGAAEHTLGQQPAILVQRMQPTMDTNRCIVAHPAGLQVIATPTPTYDHPAVVVARMARQQSQFDIYM